MDKGRNTRKTLFLLLSIVLMLVALGCSCFGVIPVLFCDTGPVSNCMQSSLLILIGAGLAFVLSIVSAVIAFHRNNN